MRMVIPILKNGLCKCEARWNSLKLRCLYDVMCGPIKERKSEFRSPPPCGMLNFNVNGVRRGKSGLSRLCNFEREIFFMFCKNIGVRDSNEVKVLAILVALCSYCGMFQETLTVESGSLNAISSVNSY